ncbi:hypothetical protein KBD71_00895 [Candidatus Woesebacteria bacterium]|nr:hypothetical protein [Candidatus Woesebacteria bacterium]
MAERVSDADRELFEASIKRTRVQAVMGKTPKEILDEYGFSPEVQEILKHWYTGSNWDMFFSRFSNFARLQKLSPENLSSAQALQLLTRMKSQRRT